MDLGASGGCLLLVIPSPTEELSVALFRLEFAHAVSRGGMQQRGSLRLPGLAQAVLLGGVGSSIAVARGYTWQLEHALVV